MRLIDADELKKLFPDYGEGSCTYNRTARMYIDNAPTIDKGYKEGHIDGMLKAEKLYARPTGEWLKDSGNIACSHCYTIWLYRRTNYCPNCGAKMKGEEE